VIKRHFLGAVAVAKLTGELGGTDNDRVVTMSTMQGWDFNTGEVFEVSIDRGLATEEKMLCIIGSRSSDGTGTLQVYVDTDSGHTYRAWDNTVIQRHPVGAKVEHVWSATDAREAMEVVEAVNDPAAPKPLHKHGTWRDLLSSTVTP
jgi:hypothetical protein